MRVNRRFSRSRSKKIRQKSRKIRAPIDDGPLLFHGEKKARFYLRVCSHPLTGEREWRVSRRIYNYAIVAKRACRPCQNYVIMTSNGNAVYFVYIHIKSIIFITLVSSIILINLSYTTKSSLVLSFLSI